MTDQAGATDTATATPTLTVTIHGANDTPVGVNDVGGASRPAASPTARRAAPRPATCSPTTPTSTASANGETKSVTGIRDRAEDAGAAPLTAVARHRRHRPSRAPTARCTIGADGTYTYTSTTPTRRCRRLRRGPDAGRDLQLPGHRRRRPERPGRTCTSSSPAPTTTRSPSTTRPRRWRPAASPTRTPGIDPTGNVLGQRHRRRHRRHRRR